MATPFLKRKSVAVVGCLIGIGSGIFSVFGFIHQVHRTHAYAVLREFGEAYEKAEEFPPGLLRAEDALFRYKRIELGYASAEFKRATADYIASVQGVVDAMKAHEDINRFDKSMEEAYARMQRLADD